MGRFAPLPASVDSAAGAAAGLEDIHNSVSSAVVGVVVVGIEVETSSRVLLEAAVVVVVVVQQPGFAEELLQVGYQKGPSYYRPTMPNHRRE